MPENTEFRLFLGQTHLKMSWIQQQIQRKDGLMSYSPPFSSPSSSPYTVNFHKESTPSSPSSGSKISPAVLFIIVILAVLFFISGLLHLLVRFLIKHPSSSASQSNRYPEISSSDALQRQLQQLFHLHDCGLDQAFIDALPVFQYKEIVGLKEPFDCPVCLCEFAEKDKLRLLPMCSHAFHINCIDTWLLSNSSCPLCRSTLYTPGYPIENPIFDFDDLGEEVGRPGIEESRFVPSQKTVEIEEHLKKSVLPVRLGKFRKVNTEAGESGEGETSNSSLDARRCYSMGSYQYILANSELRVALGNDRRNRGIKLTGETNEHPGTDSIDSDIEGKKISNVSKGESYSISKIWLWSKKAKFSSSTDTEMGMPSSLKMDLPWMEKPQGA